MSTRAGIDIYGKVLRYAEVEQRQERYHLLRLGRCDFDFDVAAALLEGAAERLEALTDALSDVFEGSTAARLYVSLHPPHCYSFFTPLPPEVSKEERKQRLLDEAALLTRSGAKEPLRLTADRLYADTLDEDERVEWYHVLAVQDGLHAGFDRVFRMLPQTHNRMMVSMHAVANAVERIEQQDEAPRQAPFSLAIGWYPTHVEYTLCHQGRWYFDHFTDADDPDDCAYFALLLLNRLDLSPAAVGRVFLYGGYQDLEAFASLGDVFTVAPEPLDPRRLIELDEQSMAADEHLDAYAPCIGVAL